MDTIPAWTPKARAPSPPGSAQPPRADGAAWGADPGSVAVDSLHLLPLDQLPLRTAGLQRARLVKTPELSSMVELFSDRASGHGLIAIDALADVFHTDRYLLERDISMLMRVSRVGSFDVYTLRMELRGLGVDVDEHKHLVLSEAKQQELTDYMRVFTRPLIKHIYGDAGDGGEIRTLGDLAALLSSPRRVDALTNLQTISRRLAIDLMEIPTFLAHYGDIFLSIAYFRSCRDGAKPLFSDFLEWLGQMRRAPTLRGDASAQRLITSVEQSLLVITGGLDQCLASFDQATDRLWQELSAPNFSAIRTTIEDHHARIGTLCCALAVKLGCWEQTFQPVESGKAQSGRGGGTGQRLDWLRRHMLPGLTDVTRVARVLTA